MSVNKYISVREISSVCVFERACEYVSVTASVCVLVRGSVRLCDCACVPV